MKPAELLRIALRALQAHKLRSFLTLLGVIIGVTTIVGVVSVINGLNVYVREKIIVLSPDVYILTRFGIIQSRKEFLEALKRRPITWSEYERCASTLTRAAMVGAGTGSRGTVNLGNRRLADVQVVGVTPNFAELFNLEFEAGGFFTPMENDAFQPVAVIGANTRDELFPGMDPIGRTILVRGLPFRVIGLMPKQGRSIGFTQDNRIYVPLQVYRTHFMPSNQSLEIYVKPQGGVAGQEASLDETRALFRAMRHTSFRAPDPFGIVTQEAAQAIWRQISGAAFILMILVASVSLGVGGVVIMNIMLVSVTERTPEIGIRLAIGARKRDIRRQFLLEAALLSMAGGVVGVLAGGLLAALVKGVAGFPAQVTPGIVISGVGLSTLVGLAAGFLPARRASNLVVIDAIRAE
ncbi:MAG TPA: ABC transporter permease [Holophaga sp.]|nr:ABC transporter permease [Holophaga sp.]